ncbi:MAG: NAD-dependent epimerase/dehydratase family protein [Thermodesulfobacteriota bacterium]|nr:NAD-dependent epimerase/dehydratase family protein [Thermodesulfobacteriota bacterium]
MRYLVTGATGFIGPYLIRKLISLRHTSRCLVRSESNTQVLEDLGAELIKGDITKPETLSGIADGMDCVLHMATLGHMSNFTVTEPMFDKINVQGTVNVMKEALRAGAKRVVHCSTVAAMGICPEVPSTEESECNPHHPYGRSKLRAEKEVLRMVAGNGLPASIIRFSMVYGPGDRRDILKLTRMAKKGLFPRVGNRPKLTPLIHVEDAVRGLLLAAEKGRPGQIYLITNGQSEPFDRVRTIIQNALGVSRMSIYVPEWAALTMALLSEKIFSFFGKAPPLTRKNIESTLADRVFSVEKAETELGFRPQVDVKAGLRDTVLWYKKNGWV